ncbi:nucleotidyltransferase family protein [Marinospirillum celere]
MIFAAGEGKRMRPLTLKTPKPLLKVAGKPLIVWHLEKLAAKKIKTVVINTSHLGEQLPLALGQGERWQLDIQYSAEATPLETGGGLLQALNLLKPEPLLLINGDIWCSHLPELDLPENKLARLFLVPNPEHHPKGDFYFNPSTQTLSNQPGADATAMTFSGISLLDPRCLTKEHLTSAYEQLPEKGQAFPLAPLLRSLVDQQLADGQAYNGDWVDVGTPLRLDQLNGYLA